MVGAGGQVAVVHISHLGVLLQELCHRQAVLTVALHPHMQALQAQIQQVSVGGRLHRAKVPHQLCGRLGDECALLAEPLGIGNAVVAVIRGAQTGELVCMGHPIKLAPVHDGTAQSCAMSVHVFGGGVGHDVCTPFQRTAVDRRGEGVVHDQRHTMSVGCLGKTLDVQHGQGRVGNGLAKHSLGIGAESGFQLLIGTLGAYKGHRDAHFCHGHRDEVEGSAIDAAGGHDVIPRRADIEQRKKVGCLAAGGQHRCGAAFQLTDLLRHIVAGGILQAGVEVALGLQIKQFSHILTGRILKCSGLDNGDLAGLAVARRVAALYADGIAFHIVSPSLPQKQPGRLYLRKRLSLLLAHSVPADWNSCTSSTSSTTQISMISV